jgi:hypothetical protein
MIKIIFISLLAVFLVGCVPKPELNKELIQTAFSAGWWCGETGKSHAECMTELSKIPSMK